MPPAFVVPSWQPPSSDALKQAPRFSLVRRLFPFILILSSDFSFSSPRFLCLQRRLQLRRFGPCKVTLVLRTHRPLRLRRSDSHLRSQSPRTVSRSRSLHMSRTRTSMLPLSRLGSEPSRKLLRRSRTLTLRTTALYVVLPFLFILILMPFS